MRPRFSERPPPPRIKKVRWRVTGKTGKTHNTSSLTYVSVHTCTNHKIYNLPSINTRLCWSSGRENYLLKSFSPTSTSTRVRHFSTCTEYRVWLCTYKHTKARSRPLGRREMTSNSSHFVLWDLTARSLVHSNMSYIFQRPNGFRKSPGLRRREGCEKWRTGTLTKRSQVILQPRISASSHSNTPHQRLRLELPNSGDSPESMESQKAAPAPIIVCLSLTNLTRF